MITNITYVLAVTITLFFIGFLGIILNRKNILITIMSIEIMLLSVNLNFAIFSVYLDDIVGQVFVLFILTVAATESSIGLSIVLAHYKLKKSIRVERIKSIKG